ncbi:XrtA system polysaccharide chain length determinant [Caenispirillum salinarum]|uniref:XrtA system polysaccharide chain length determinant n=1 Tax=Caenispirillum salinarum TaxID=859058 RepID=UPI00384D6461
MKDILSQLQWYLPALWRRRWQILGVAWLLCALGWAAVAMVPNEYRVATKVHIDTDSLLRPLLRGLTVDINPMQQINLMQRTLVSRTNLERVARMTDLDLQARNETAMAELLGSLGDRIRMARDRANIFTISFTDKDPQTAYKVVQALLSIYMENNAGSTRREFDSARQFIDSQLQKYEEQMNEAEARLNTFKTQYLGYLPGNTTFVNHLNAKREEMKSLDSRLVEARARADEMKLQLSEIPEFVPVEGSPGGPPSGTEVRIMNLEQRVDEMLLNYTEQHPDVIAARRLLDRLRADYDQEMRDRSMAAAQFAAATGFGDEVGAVDAAVTEDGESGPAAGQAAQDAGPPVPKMPNSLYQSIKLSLVDAEAQVAALVGARARVEEELAALEKQVDRMPEIQGQLDRLNRDYTMARRNYEQLLERRETATISESREMNADKVQFRVIDPPQVPVLPDGYQRPMLLSGVLIAGLGVGLGIAVLLASFQSNFVSTLRLAQIVGLPVLGSVSMVSHESRFARSLRLTSFGGALSALVAVYAGLMVVELQVGLPNAVPDSVKTEVMQRVQPLIEKVQ